MAGWSYNLVLRRACHSDLERGLHIKIIQRALKSLPCLGHIQTNLHQKLLDGAQVCQDFNTHPGDSCQNQEVPTVIFTIVSPDCPPTAFNGPLPDPSFPLSLSRTLDAPNGKKLWASCQRENGILHTKQIWLSLLSTQNCKRATALRLF